VSKENIILIKVVHYQRKLGAGFHSIERVFEDIRSRLGPQTQVKAAVSHYPSKCLLRRLYNAIEAAFRQEAVNHVTGDVHYLTCLLWPRKLSRRFMTPL